MRSLAVVFLVSIAAAAQSSLQNAPPESVSCPVSISAKRLNNSHVERIEKGVKLRTVQPRVSVSMSAPGERRIQSVTVVAHGPRKGAHIQLTGPGDYVTFTATLNATGGKISGNVTPNTMSAVHWIEVAEIHWADGSSWKSSDTERCTAEPPGFLLVNNRQQ